MERLELLQNLRKPLWEGVKLGSAEQTAMALMWQAANDICKLRDENERLRLRLLKGVVDSDLLKTYDGSALERADKYIEQLETEMATVKAERDKAVKCIGDVETYLEMGSAKYIKRTIDDYRESALAKLEGEK